MNNTTKEHAINWYGKTYFYILDINGKIKIGITANWENRLHYYRKEVGELPIQVLKTEEFAYRWRAELLEQMMVERLRTWAYHGRREWFGINIQIVVDCFVETRNRMKPYYWRYENVHKLGKRRFDAYFEIAHKMFSIKQQAHKSLTFNSNALTLFSKH